MLDKVVYQIYPKSFMDSNGDGIGDIQGIIQKLDYIEWLCVDYIWITPVFKSPQRDNGYDVSNYLEIDPIFGTIADLKELVDKAAERNIGIMLDMVFNHTSTEHEWFKRALSGEEKYENYYFFEDEPVDWDSKFGGKAFEYLPEKNKYYLHLYDVTQADLKWRNSNVRTELYSVVNYWLDFGIKGFRFDVINVIGKDEILLDGDKTVYTDKPIVHEYLKEMRTKTYQNRPDILTVGEMSSTSIENSLKYASVQKDELDTIFSFHHLKVDYENGSKWTIDFFDFSLLKEILSTWQTAFSKYNSNLSLFWSNHDQPRIASRFIKATNQEMQLRKNKMLATCMYLQRGTSYIFQGEEIGMLNNHFTTIEEFNDVESTNFYNNSKLTNDLKLAILNQKSRDNSRTPFAWNTGNNNGFTTNTPWLKGNSYQGINVQDQVSDANSTLNFYRELIKLKKANQTLITGDYEMMANDSTKLYSFMRTDDKSTYQVLANFFEEKVSLVEYNLKGEIILSNSAENCLTELQEFGCIVIKVN
ncbi:MAG: glycoside hydrolase family 13 protein [Mycoplasmatales bacterium]